MKIICFDTETVIDHFASGRLKYINEESEELLQQLEKMQSGDLSVEQDKVVQDAREYMENYHLEITDNKNSFHRHPFHCLVAISFTIIDIDNSKKDSVKIEDIRSSKCKSNIVCNAKNIYEYERGILIDFVNTISEIIKSDGNTVLVTFNGRKFDIPVIKYRAMLHGIPMPKLLERKYSNRYESGHTDLLETFSDYGLSAYIKMKEVCSVFGIPCKQGGVDGSKVSDMFDKGQMKEINEYCELDAIATSFLYVRYLMLKGSVNGDGYRNFIESIKLFIDKNETEGEFKNITEFLKEIDKNKELYTKLVKGNG